MSMLGELSFFRGVQISQSNEGIFISKTKYIKEMLKKFRMEDCNAASTPMVTGCKLSKDNESLDADQTKYRSMIGNLLYVTTTRLDIMQAVGFVARFQATTKETHVQAIKSIFKYLKGTMDFGLWYPKEKDLTLIAYMDADWVGDVDDRKSTSDGVFFLGKSLVSRLSKKQASVSLSIAKVEYIGAAVCCTHV
ncbi:secreted RxLR effector protein 161-like [Cryptomeria japonica]|uniref:secreted RxLR effector protein 161-like n=1 Tax=Cryptomeria japonica TaxID=3369 RepID=UPI0027DA708E|nr:secreted RxLR effector protein 161-like [Cryptomeria japonica]